MNVTCTTINPILWHVLYSEWLLVVIVTVLQMVMGCDVSNFDRGHPVVLIIKLQVYMYFNFTQSTTIFLVYTMLIICNIWACVGTPRDDPGWLVTSTHPRSSQGGPTQAHML